jgi:predicted metalloprotease with PDZ domain
MGTLVVNIDLRDYLYSDSPYVRGVVIAIWLDSTIRKSTHGKYCLDNVMFDTVLEEGRPFEESRVLRTIDRYLPAAAQRELQQAVSSGTLPPLADAIVAPCLHVSMDDVPKLISDWTTRRLNRRGSSVA